MPNIAHYSHDTNHETEKPHSKDAPGNSGKEKNGKPKKSRRQKIFPKPLYKGKTIELLENKPKSFSVPLYHLQGKQSQRYLTLDNTERNSFEVALEVLNRRGVRKVRKPCPVTNEISQYFYECIGRVQITCRMCVVCRDVHKDHAMIDQYFMDLVEISQERRVLCLNCMINLVNSQVTDEKHTTQNELIALRTQQPRGVYIDPFLITCGY
jgi:hypothetical protein